MDIPRNEHPRMQFRRDNWINLNGCWQFEIDQSRSGYARGLHQNAAPLKSIITVPFCPESALSGIGHTDFINAVWYRRTITLSPADDLLFLHFGAVDYACTVYVNGQEAGHHKGGYTSFSVDITPYVHEGDNDLCVYAEDDTRDTTIPSGKQSHEYHSFGCFYTRTTGIWQTVWLERVPKTHIKQVVYTPQPYSSTVTMQFTLQGEATLDIDVTYDDKSMATLHQESAVGVITFTLPLAETYLWEPGHGRLYDVTLRFGDDTVHSYFGLRDIRIDGHDVLINNKRVFQRLVLDQGYYPDGIYTAPTDDDLRRDIELSLAVGFNGARLHEKVFEERYLYHADRMGYLVWGEYPDWGLDYTDPAHIHHILPEWIEAVTRDRNHPAVIGWCPHNETWDKDGRKQHNDSIALLYHVTKQIDPSRPCIDTSGNYHVVTDIFCVHNYEQDPHVLKAQYDTLMTDGELFDVFRDRQTYRGEPCFVSEYGGIAWNADDSGWGYGNAPTDIEAFYERFDGLTKALLDNDRMFGFCYTQLTDVEQEQNGLYTYDRQPKFDTARLRDILTRPAAYEK